MLCGERGVSRLVNVAGVWFYRREMTQRWDTVVVQFVLNDMADFQFTYLPDGENLGMTPDFYAAVNRGGYSTWPQCWLALSKIGQGSDRTRRARRRGAGRQYAGIGSGTVPAGKTTCSACLTPLCNLIRESVAASLSSDDPVASADVDRAGGGTPRRVVGAAGDDGDGV